METKGGFYITQIKHLQNRIFEKLLNAYDLNISGGQGRILFVLWKNRELMTLKEISRQTSLAKNTTSIIVDGMVSKGMVKKIADQDDKRKSWVDLTDKTNKMMQKYEEVSDIMGQLFYEGFSKKEQDELEAYLERILLNLKKLDDRTAEQLISLKNTHF